MRSFGMACAAAALVASIHAAAAKAAEPEALLYANALASIYAEKCPSWKVNWMRSVQLLEEAGLDVDRLDRPETLARMTAAASKAGEAVQAVGEAEICRRSEAEFGPKGTHYPGLMSNSLAVRGLNRLFDWLEDGGK